MSDATTAESSQNPPLPPGETLHQRLLRDPGSRPRILADCERVIQEEVNAKSGLSGMVIKTAFKMVGKIKPGIIREAMDGLLDDFIARVEPFYAAHRDAGAPGSFAAALLRQRTEVADALLGITDDRARRAPAGVAKEAYEKLRPQAKKHVEEAIPRVSQMLERHL